MRWLQNHLAVILPSLVLSLILMAFDWNDKLTWALAGLIGVIALVVACFLHENAFPIIVKYVIIYLLPWFILPSSQWLDENSLSGISFVIGTIGWFIVVIAATLRRSRSAIKSNFFGAVDRHVHHIRAQIFSVKLVAQRFGKRTVDLVLCHPGLQNVRYLSAVTVNFGEKGSDPFVAGRYVTVGISHMGYAETVDGLQVQQRESLGLTKAVLIGFYAVLTLLYSIVGYPFPESGVTIQVSMSDIPFTPIHPWVFIPWLAIVIGLLHCKYLNAPQVEELSAPDIVFLGTKYLQWYGVRVKATVNNVRQTGVYINEQPQIEFSLTFPVAGSPMTVTHTQIVLLTDLPRLRNREPEVIYWPSDPSLLMIAGLGEPVFVGRPIEIDRTTPINDL